MDNNKFKVDSMEKKFESNKVSLIKRALRIREAVMLMIILITIIILTILSPHFLAIANFKAMARGFAMEGIVTIGMTILLVSGSFDLSVGSVMSLCGVISCWFLVQGVPIPLAILLGLLAGAALGAINGFMVTKVKVNALIATLAMMSVARGLALVATQGTPLAGFSKSYVFIGQGEFLQIPLPFWIMLVFAILCDFMLRRSRYFRQFYYIGGNEKAARLTGIKVNMVKLVTFIAMGILAALAGIISNARLMSAIPTAFTGVEMRVIAACVIGGSSLAGGEGTILGSLLGLMFMSLISNAMTILGVSPYWEGVVVGTILAIAASMDMLSRKKFI